MQGGVVKRHKRTFTIGGSVENQKRGWNIALIAIAVKLGAKMLGPLVKFAKAFKVFKFGLFTASLGVYAYLWSWQFASVLMGGLFVHEMGHVWAMKREGVPHRGINFIPFLGAIIVPEKDFPTRKSEAVIGIMGPVWGGALALVTLGAYKWTQEPLVAAIAGWIAMLNLFNLMPVAPLDGGRVVKSVAFSIHSRLGVAVMIMAYVGLFILAFFKGFALFWFIMVVGAIELTSGGREAYREARFEKARERVTVWLAAEFGVPATKEAVIECIHDCIWYLKKVPLQTRLEHPVLAFLEEKREEADLGPLTGRGMLFFERHRASLTATVLEDLGYFVLRNRFGNEEQTTEEFLGKWWYPLDILVEKGIIEFIQRRGKESMTVRQNVMVFLGYAALVMLLAAILFATEHVEGAKHALEIFKS